MTICELAGITEHYEHIVHSAAVGFVFTNPTLCLSGVIGLWLGKFAAHKYSEKLAREELSKFTDLFCKVTSNFNNRYEAANKAITEFYSNGDR
jgi:hypothetical protein